MTEVGITHSRTLDLCSIIPFGIVIILYVHVRCTLYVHSIHVCWLLSDESGPTIRLSMYLFRCRCHHHLHNYHHHHDHPQITNCKKNIVSLLYFSLSLSVFCIFLHQPNVKETAGLSPICFNATNTNMKWKDYLCLAFNENFQNHKMCQDFNVSVFIFLSTLASDMLMKLMIAVIELICLGCNWFKCWNIYVKNKIVTRLIHNLLFLLKNNFQNKFYIKSVSIMNHEILHNTGSKNCEADRNCNPPLSVSFWWLCCHIWGYFPIL